MRPSVLIVVALGAACVTRDDAAVDDTTPGPDSDPPAAVETDPPGETGRETDEPQVPIDGLATWTLGAPVNCADPSARAARAYDRVGPGGAWDDQPFDPSAQPMFAGGGVTVLDLDDDGVIDVLRTSAGDGFRWYALESGGAVDRTPELPPIPSGTGGVTAVDFDGDGDLDLHVTVFGGPDLLLRRDADGWVDVAEALGVAGPPLGQSVASSWADADGDGDLDAFVGGYGELGDGLGPLPPGEPSRLYLQQADGTFVDAIAPLRSTHPLKQAHTFLGGWLQLDDDAAMELYVVNDFGWRFPNAAYDVVGGDVRTLGPLGFESRGTNMGLALGDLNGDGLEDLVVPELGSVFLYVSSPAGWFEASAASGMLIDRDRHQIIGWGAELADLDHDGDLDALVAFGQLDEAARIQPTAPLQPDAAWILDGGRYVDRAPAWGLDQGEASRGFAVVDVDGDGWLDVVKQDLKGPTRLYRARCGAESWLVVELRQEGPNTRAIGARVVVVDGERRMMRTVRAGGTSYASQGPAEVHFGLGDREVAARVEVHWPDGGVDVALDVPARRRVTVRR